MHTENATIQILDKGNFQFINFCSLASPFPFCPALTALTSSLLNIIYKFMVFCIVFALSSHFYPSVVRRPWSLATHVNILLTCFPLPYISTCIKIELIIENRTIFLPTSLLFGLLSTIYIQLIQSVYFMLMIFLSFFQVQLKSITTATTSTTTPTTTMISIHYISAVLP